MISSKRHLEYLQLNYSASGHTIGTGGAEVEQQQQSVSEEVLEKLCPPTCLENLSLRGIRWSPATKLDVCSSIGGLQEPEVFEAAEPTLLHAAP